MCGIAGWFTSDQPLTNSRGDEVCARMLAVLRHRGPDDSGKWCDPKGSAVFLHTRLAILDLSPAGHQPMLSSDGRLVIIFNGEIYNFRELRKELEAGGTQFTTNSDTEVILKLYEQRGEACVRSLRGMFAFAIWDTQRQTGFLARDPFGVKPLYYCQRDGRFLFASELRVLVASSAVSPEVDPQSLRNYFESGSVCEPEGLLRDVASVPAGHTVTWEAGRIRKERFWSVDYPDQFDDITVPDAVRLVREALQDSVRAHFVSDVPVGIFLSGGVDSAAILALARSIFPDSDLRTFSIAVDDPQLDESSIAERTAAHFRTRHATERIDAQAAVRLFPEFLASLDAPSIDGFNTWLVSSLARRQGMKVVLSGLGGDELFGGYPSFWRVPRLARVGHWLSGIAPLGRGIGYSLEKTSRSSRWQRLGSFLRGQNNLYRAYQAYRGVFTNNDATRLAAHFTGQPESSITSANPVCPPLPADSRDAISALELTCYMRCQLLRDSDVMSMAHGLELRVPYVDRKLFEVLRRIPPHIRIQSEKQLLKKAVPEVPQEVLQAPKRGFTLPYRKWLDGEYHSLVEESCRDLPVRPREWYQRWCVFAYRQWMERITQISP